MEDGDDIDIDNDVEVSKIIDEIAGGMGGRKDVMLY